MKTDTQLMNEIAVETGYLKPITPAEAQTLKDTLLDIYRAIAALCDKYGLTYMMGGGTCLGAVRHQGFIPWDDDLDINMPRESYIQFIELCKKGELGEKYEIDYPNKQHDCKNLHLKVYRKNTLDVEIIAENAPGPKGVFIDVFPMDFAPHSKIMQRLKGALSDCLIVICTSVLYTEYPSKHYHDFMHQTSEGIRRYRMRKIIGKFFGIIPHKKWVWWFDRFNAQTKKTNYVTYSTGRRHFVGEIQPLSTFLPVQKGLFEGMEVNLPANYDQYLKGLYGDYMKIPPVEKRERHFVYKLLLPEYKV